MAEPIYYQYAGPEAYKEVADQEAADVAASNSATNNSINAAALAQTRRRAGGTTFRRRGAGTSANAMVSGLGAANAKALADKRRANLDKLNRSTVWTPSISTFAGGFYQF